MMIKKIKQSTTCGLNLDAMMRDNSGNIIITNKPRDRRLKVKNITVV